MKQIDINAVTGGGGVGVGMPALAAFKEKWEGKLNEVASRIDGMAVFAGGRWFRSRMECVDFEENNIPEGKFQCLLDKFSYIQFTTGETVLTA